MPNVHEMNGKYAIRIKPVTVNVNPGFLSDTRNFEDCSYTSEPVFIENVANDVVFQKEKDGRLRVVPARYCQDDEWREISKEIAEKIIGIEPEKSY
jgi:hypothetical protein